MLAEGAVKSQVTPALSTGVLRCGLPLSRAANASQGVVARSNSRDDRQSSPAALQPPVGRSVLSLVVALTKPIWVLECALMGKTIYEDVHGAGEIAERTESNGFYLWQGIGRVEDAPASASHESVICFPGFGPVFCRYLGDSAVRSSEERAPSVYAALFVWSSWHPSGAAEALDRLDALDLEHLESRGLKDRALEVVCSREVGNGCLQAT